MDDAVDDPPIDCQDGHVIEAPTWSAAPDTPADGQHPWIPNADNWPDWWSALRRLHEAAAVVENIDEG